MRGCYGLFAEQWRRERLDYDAVRGGRWVQAFGHSGSRLGGRFPFLAFRLFQALFLTGILAWNVLDAVKDGPCYGLYFTHWCAVLLAVYGWLALWTAKQADAAKPRPMPWYAKAAWISLGLLLPMSFWVFAIFWCVLVPVTGEIWASGVFTHGVNFLALLVDIFVSRQPCCLLHAAYFGALCFVYYAFTLIFHLAGGMSCFGGRAIYPFLNWSRPLFTSALAVAALVCGPLLDLLFRFAVSQCFASRCQGSTQHQNGVPPPDGPLDVKDRKNDEEQSDSKA